MGFVMIVLCSARLQITWPQATLLVVICAIYLAVVIAWPNLELLGGGGGTTATTAPTLAPEPSPPRRHVMKNSGEAKEDFSSDFEEANEDLMNVDGEETKEDDVHWVMALLLPPIESPFQRPTIGGPRVHSATMLSYLSALSFAAMEMTEEIAG